MECLRDFARPELVQGVDCNSCGRVRQVVDVESRIDEKRG
jgi:hypothetical protein